MNRILFLFLLLPLIGKTQCEAVSINSFQLNDLLNCNYRINITATLLYGNASFIITYKCGNETKKIDKCFTWDSPSTIFVEEEFYCDCINIVEPIVLIHASSNCNGNICRRVSLTNLLLIQETYKEKEEESEIFITNKMIISKKIPIQSITIYSQDGSEIYKDTTKKMQFTIPDVKEGMHVLVINTEYKTIIKKIIKL